MGLGCCEPMGWLEPLGDRGDGTGDGARAECIAQSVFRSAGDLAAFSLDGIAHLSAQYSPADGGGEPGGGDTGNGYGLGGQHRRVLGSPLAGMGTGLALSCSHLRAGLCLYGFFAGDGAGSGLAAAVDGLAVGGVLVPQYPLSLGGSAATDPDPISVCLSIGSAGVSGAVGGQLGGESLVGAGALGQFLAGGFADGPTGDCGGDNAGSDGNPE